MPKNLPNMTTVEVDSLLSRVREWHIEATTNVNTTVYRVRVRATCFNDACMLVRRIVAPNVCDVTFREVPE